MNSLPPSDRGAGGAMNQTFQNSAQVLSIGIFFTLMIVGLAATLPDDDERRAAGARRRRRDRAPRPRRCRRSRSCSPRSSATTRSSTSSARTCSPALSAHDQAVLTGSTFFPHAHLRPVPRRAARRVRVRDRRLPDRGRGVADARRPSAHDDDPAPAPRRRSRAPTEGAACRLSGTDSRPSASTDGETTVFIDPFGDVRGAQRARDALGLPGDRGRRRRPAARHPRAPRPQRRRGDRRRSADAALDRRAPRVADRRGLGVASEHDDVAGTAARAQHALRLHARRAARRAPRRPRPARAARRAGRGARQGRPAVRARSAAARRSAPSRRRGRRGRRAPRWSCRCTTAPSASTSSSRSTRFVDARGARRAPRDRRSSSSTRCRPATARSSSCPPRPDLSAPYGQGSAQNATLRISALSRLVTAGRTPARLCVWYGSLFMS